MVKIQTVTPEATIYLLNFISSESLGGSRDVRRSGSSCRGLSRAGAGRGRHGQNEEEKIETSRADSQLMGLLHLSLDFVQHLLHPPQLEQAHCIKMGTFRESCHVREVFPSSDPLGQG